MRTAPARTPLVVAVLGVVALVVIVGPLLALGIRVPWERFGEVLRDSATAELLRVTFLAAAWALGVIDRQTVGQLRRRPA